MAIAPVVMQVGGALVSAAPAVLDKALSYVRTATKGRVSTPAQLQKFVKRGAAQAGVVAQGLAQGGMPVDKIVSAPADANADQASAQLHASLTRMYGIVAAAVDTQKIDVGQHTTLDDTTKDVIRRDMALRLRRTFGSCSNAQKVAAALASFTSADYAWAKAMGFD